LLKPHNENHPAAVVDHLERSPSAYLSAKFRFAQDRSDHAPRRPSNLRFVTQLNALRILHDELAPVVDVEEVPWHRISSRQDPYGIMVA
jgi:hypothetical protein